MNAIGAWQIKGKTDIQPPEQHQRTLALGWDTVGMNNIVLKDIPSIGVLMTMVETYLCVYHFPVPLGWDLQKAPKALAYDLLHCWKKVTKARAFDHLHPHQIIQQPFKWERSHPERDLPHQKTNHSSEDEHIFLRGKHLKTIQPQTTPAKCFSPWVFPLNL